MGVTTQWRSGAATDSGRLRTENQDRSLVDDDLGVFLVVDGLGGHAAGEKAAETAVESIRDELAASGGDVAHRIRTAICAANNRICDLADANEAWRGMACVLTLAVVDGDKVCVGHVGDSRLYLVWNGVIRKLTSDHSPVGEREDRGELSEQEAMLHPRRHEVFPQRRVTPP
jgi:serine/threonine protein phosphatase PrpC